MGKESKPSPEIAKLREGTSELPRTLDVVKINGRWGQIFKGPGSELMRPDNWISVRWLDTKKGERFLLKDLTSFPYSGTIVGDLKDQFTDIEFKNIHWGQEETEHPELRNHVTVWGELTAKDAK